MRPTPASSRKRRHRIPSLLMIYPPRRRIGPHHNRRAPAMLNLPSILLLGFDTREVDAMLLGALDVLPGRTTTLPSSFCVSTMMAHMSVSRTSCDGNEAASSQLPSSDRPAVMGVAAAPFRPLTRVTPSDSSDCTNRKTTSVASARGRASIGLQVRIFRRSLNRRVVEREVGRGCAAKVRLLGVEEVVEIEVCDGLEGVVTNQIIVVRSAGVGGSED